MKNRVSGTKWRKPLNAANRVLHMCFDRFLLAFESRDLSQADKSIIRVSSFPSLVISGRTFFSVSQQRSNAQIFCKMNPLNSLRFTFHQKNWARCLLFNPANDCLLNWANSQKWQLFSLKLLFWVKIGVILWICLTLQVVVSFSAWEKSCDSTHRIFILEHKMRSLRRGHVLFIFLSQS